MRLGEIYTKLNKVLDSNSLVKIECSHPSNDQNYLIINYPDLMGALSCVSNFSWIGQDFTHVQEVIEQ